MKILLDKGFKPSSKFINLIIENKGNEGISLLELIFQYVNFSNDVVLKFLINYYLNKIPLSQSDLIAIIIKENEILNNILKEDYNNYDITDLSLGTLGIVCENENETIFKFLIEYGFDLNAEYEMISYEDF